MKISLPNILILLSLFLFSSLSAQDTTQVREYFVNRDEPNAVYGFTFVHMTDIHIGEGQGDYGTPGFLNDTMPNGDVGYSAIRLRKSVDWINEHAKEQDIRFVMVTGDITDSGERSEFEKAKEILDDLKIPYVPTIGNHDIWPYVKFQQEAEYAYGDSVMAEVFKDTYDKAALFFDHWDDGTRLTRVYNPESLKEHYHQNFSFAYQNVGFLAFDFNPRYHVRKDEPGVGAEARLNDFAGGTYPWLLNTLENYPYKRDKNLILMTHQPPHRDITAIFNGLPLVDNDKMTKDLMKYKDNLALWIAGHVHRNMNYSVRTIGGGMKVVDVRETAANKEYDQGLFTLIRVYTLENPTSIKESIIANSLNIYPNPSNSSINVHLLNSDRVQNISIFNMNGEKIWSNQYNNSTQRNYSISIFDLPQGIYLLQVHTEDLTVQKTFIKMNN
ncbi:MAG: metallophosphoesterase [Chitinophagales bacterium]|nr:metallophosphoesterase [Chitinophagales bacterium]MCZ2393713.1 metallophosphoesterase [Chitinophagales bacterium]